MNDDMNETYVTISRVDYKKSQQVRSGLHRFCAETQIDKEKINNKKNVQDPC